MHVPSTQVQRALLLLHEMKSLGVPRNAVVYGHIINCFCSKVKGGERGEGKGKYGEKRQGQAGGGDAAPPFPLASWLSHAPGPGALGDG